MNCVDGGSDSEEEARVCTMEWVECPKDKPLACSFLQPSPGKIYEIKFTFDVTKCDRLFDVLLQNGVIRLSEGHVVPPPGQIAKGKYCKWHGTFSHNTNDCNYFRRQVQSALNDNRLTLGDGNKMRLDSDPFPVRVNMINVLVRTSQADSTQGKNVVMSDEPRARMMKPRSPEPRVWKLNQRRKVSQKIRPMFDMLLEKCTRLAQRRSVFSRLGNNE